MKARVGRWIDTLRPTDLFALPVVLGVSAEFALVQLASPYNTAPHVLLTLVLQVVAALMVFAVLGVVYLALRRTLDVATMRRALLVCIPLAAMVAGVGVTWARMMAGLDAVPLWLVRTGSAMMHITAMTILLWLAVSNIRLHYQRLEALTEEHDRLDELDLQATRQLADINVEAVEAVRTRILRGLQRSGPLNAQATRAMWTSTLEDIVRPLSRQLESETEDWAAPTPAARRPQRIDWKAAMLDGTAPALFNPVGVLVILNLIGAPMNLGRVGVVFTAQFIAISAVVVWPIYWLMRRIAIRLAGQAGGGRRIAAFLAMCVLSGVMFGAVMLPLTLGAPQPLRFMYLCPIFTAIVAFCWGLAAAAQNQARATEQELAESAADLQWQLVRSRELHRQRRRALAHALHGRVQAALAAGIIELDQAIAKDVASDALVDAIHGRIISCVRELDLHDTEPSSIEVVADKIRATWAGLLALTVTIDPLLETALRTDSQCLMTLNDLIPELVFNSVKHGGSRNVAVHLERVDHRTMRLIAASVDTAHVTPTGGTGLGSRLLDTCAITWSRTSQEDCSVTTVLLPVAPLSEEAEGARFKGFPLKSAVFANTPT